MRKLTLPSLLKAATINLLFLIASHSAATAQAILLDPLTQPKFVNPLPIPGVIDATNGGTFTITMSEFTQDLGLVDPVDMTTPLLTRVWGYNNTYPGPTIRAMKDVPVKVFWQNKLVDNKGTPLSHLLPVDESIHWSFRGVSNWQDYGVPTVAHLHGGHTESASDGLPEAWYTPNFTAIGKDFVKGEMEPYHYDNDQQAATLWYHDHALGITRLNVYAGLAGFYLLTDPVEQQLKSVGNLPADPYDIELVIQDRQFTADGQLFYPSTPAIPGSPDPGILPEFFGNFILVNGKTWPVLDVEPRQYSFRLLNGSDSRFYNLFLSSGGNIIQVASDDGLLPAPVVTTKLLIAPGERKQVILDFSDPALWGQTIIVRNNARSPYPKGVTPSPNTEGQVMAFRVTRPLNASYPLTPVPAALTASPQFPIASTSRQLILFEGTDEYGRLKPMLGTVQDGILSWEENITENPAMNSTELWEVYNLTPDAHPIHLHLVKFQVLNTQKFRATIVDPQKGILSNIKFLGMPKLPDAGDRGWKDTYPIFPGEMARLVANFDREGLYVWHCHILSHEDHEMMRPLYVGDMNSNALKNGSLTKEDENNKTSIGEMLSSGDFSIYPNPFADYTLLSFNVESDANVRIEVYNSTGKKVKEVNLGNLNAGRHSRLFYSDGLNSGIYLCKFSVGANFSFHRLVINK